MPQAPADPTPPTLAECSLVMKGGITSGVVYPQAVTELAVRYRFRRIGGSSAGAIAAVLAAAAEYHRGQTGTMPDPSLPGTDPATGQPSAKLTAPAPAPPVASPAAPPPAASSPSAPRRQGPPLPADAWDPDAVGFERLRRLPSLLQTQLPLLFAPPPSTTGVFDFLTTWIEPDWSPARRILVSLGRLVRWGWLPFTVVTLGLLVPAFLSATALVQGLRPQTWWPVAGATALWLPLAVAGGLLAAALVLGRGAWRAINHNGLGMVNGHLDDNSDALTDWLAREINLTAGRKPSDPPLTFGDLWGPGATAEFRQTFTRGTGGQARFEHRVPSIAWTGLDPDLDLRVMTTCLTHRLPYSFPFSADTYLFCPRCLAGYFPSGVSRALVEHSRDAVDAGDDWTPPRCPSHDAELRRLPFAPDIPVVVAARLSLSFPVLISAVPLYYLDFFQRREDERTVPVVTAWFSDGGITSNFPMQFFDAWLPNRPTFGINLDSFEAGYDDQAVTLPAATKRARLTETPIHSAWGLLRSMVTTMQDWPDRVQMDSPGFKDRIATVRTAADEGGLHLAMTPEVIARLSAKGALAGAKLRDDFDFELHRWLRFRIAMNGLSVALARFSDNLPDFEANLPEPWVRPTYQFRASREARVRQAARDLAALADAWEADGWPANRDQPPRPEPMLKFGPADR
ncbi:MAG: patatin-like phospholipase family protein [Propionicimonas sp.]|nr:patatin-like phospholipase family protein [Propionicimonas sp.]